MNLIYIIVATRVSNVLLPQLRTNLFSIRSWEIAEPSNVSIDTTMGTSRILTKHAQKYNTDASLDSSPCKKDASNTKKASSYCCVVPSSLIKAIGSAWKWNGFQVRDTTLSRIYLLY
ncbi:putative alternative oxidase [Helianthus annuus]|nr:putative alternative oxidase [Helianthus annuus]KAJ0608959.1 putative alternative oxidase [Helianthus annuus]